MSLDIWYCTGQPTRPPLLDHDLAELGGTPPEELAWEDGLEAPLRPTLRHAHPGHAERLEETLPDLEALWESTLTKEPQLLREAQAARRERERAEASRIAAIKAQHRVRRRAAELAEWRSKMRAKYPTDPRWQP